MTVFLSAMIAVYEKETPIMSWFLQASFLLNVLIGIAVFGICVVFVLAHVRFRRNRKKPKDQ